VFAQASLRITSFPLGHAALRFGPVGRSERTSGEAAFFEGAAQDCQVAAFGEVRRPRPGERRLGLFGLGSGASSGGGRSAWKSSAASRCWRVRCDSFVAHLPVDLQAERIRARDGYSRETG